MVFFVFSDLLGMVFRLDGSVLFALKGGTLCEVMQTELGSRRRKRPRKEFKLKRWGDLNSQFSVHPSSVIFITC